MKDTGNETKPAEELKARGYTELKDAAGFFCQGQVGRETRDPKKEHSLDVSRSEGMVYSKKGPMTQTDMCLECAGQNRATGLYGNIAKLVLPAQQ